MTLPQWQEYFHLKRSDPVVLTYMTSISERWALGVTAAYFKIPLVVVGHGKYWTRRLMQKIEGVIEALRHFHDDRPIIFLDGTDVLLLNSLDTVMEAYRRSKADILFSGECNSWPKCLKEDYAKAGHSCPAGSHACFVNSGVYVATAAKLKRGLQAILALSKKSGEQNDQYVANQLFLAQKEHQLTLALDHSSTAFLSAWQCYGRVTKYETCQGEAWDPMSKLTIQPDHTIVLQVDPTHTQTPTVLHMNGAAWPSRARRGSADRHSVPCARERNGAACARLGRRVRDYRQ